MITLLANFIIFQLIYIRARSKFSIWYSDFQIEVLNFSFYFILFNMLLVPGLDLPEEQQSIFELIVHLKEHLQGGIFENVPRDYLATVMIQQTFFGALYSLAGFSILQQYFFSPGAFLLYKWKSVKEQVYLKDEYCIFDFGYYQSLNLTLLSLVIVYSLEFPVLLFLGIIYFISRLLLDAHSLLNLHKKEIDSSGRLI